MATPSTVPVTITAEAAAHVAELGMQAEFERMLEHARQVIPGLKRLEVELQPPYDTGDEPAVVILALQREVGPPDASPQMRFGEWQVHTFSPDVFRHFTLLAFGEPDNAG
jgi:hypothetical protein